MMSLSFEFCHQEELVLVATTTVVTPTIRRVEKCENLPTPSERAVRCIVFFGAPQPAAGSHGAGSDSKQHRSKNSTVMLESWADNPHI